MKRGFNAFLVCWVSLGATACGREAPTAFDGADLGAPSAVLAHGERLSHVLGCTGCHGPRLEGTLVRSKRTGYGPIYASNLTLAVRAYSDDQLDDIIRKGIHPARKTVWGMPSQIFQYVSDPDFKALLTYLRTLKPKGSPLPPPVFGPNDRRDIALARYAPAVEMVEEFKRSQPIDLGMKYALGRYITTVSCTECHGAKLQGDPATKAPDLVVVSVYSRAEFERLATAGIPLGNRRLDPMMYYVARGRLSHMTAHERDALYSYLVARAKSQ